MRTVKVPRKQNNSILGPIGIVIECPGAELFNAEAELTHGKNRIRHTTKDFQDLIRGIVERDVAAVHVAERPFLRSAIAAEICKTVGRKRALRLTDLAHLLRTKKKSFLTVVSVRNTLWAVYADWCPCCGGWSVLVYSVVSLGGWGAGSQVLLQVSRS